jgi:hypothetical protein
MGVGVVGGKRQKKLTIFRGRGKREHVAVQITLGFN